MNKLNKITGALLMFASLNLFAQEDCPEMEGQYVIGASEESDFASFHGAVNALTCGGVSGPVVFVVEPGTYNEKVNISAITGVSAFNTVTFRSQSGNNTDAVIRFNSSDAVITLSGAAYVSFENITIDRQNATFGNCVYIEGNTFKVSFTGVVMNGVNDTRVGAESAVVNCTSNGRKREISFRECELNYGSIGISKGAMADAEGFKTSVSSTLFYNQYESAISMSSETAPVVTGNVINSNSGYPMFKAMNFEDISGGGVISNNIISAATGYGLVMNNCSASVETPGQLENNNITIGGNTNAFGIYITGSTNNQVLRFNHIKLSVDKTEAAYQAFFKNNSSGKNIGLANNNCYDLNAGTYIVLGNTYQDFFSQTPSLNKQIISASATGTPAEKADPDGR